MLACAVAGACASSGSTTTTPRTEDGVYEFIGRTGEHAELRGSLIVAGGELLLEPEQGICRVDFQNVVSEKTRFLCDNTSEIEDLAFLIDRRTPLMRSTWTGSVRQKRQRTVCVQYAIQNGRQVCVRSATETYETRVQLRGPLTFRRRTEGSQPGAG
jgi:hypothetical protein